MSVDGAGPPVSDLELLILRNVALKLLRGRACGALAHFAHRLCEGTLERGSAGTCRGEPGTYYHADLDFTGPGRRICNFFLPTWADELVFDENDAVMGYLPLDGGFGYGNVQPVNHHLAELPEDLATSASPN